MDWLIRPTIPFSNFTRYMHNYNILLLFLVKFHFLSKHYWRHLDKCSTYVGSPRLKMSNEQAWSYTWASAKYIKKLVSINLGYSNKIMTFYFIID